MTERASLAVTSGGELIDATRFISDSDALTRDGRRPCVVMAHGIGATADSGLHGFAEELVGTGVDVVTFDYRHFARSGGQPRQLVDPRRQVADYHAVIAAVRRQPDLDPERVVAWGVSFSGGHVLRVAAEDRRLAAAISLTPAVDGAAVLAAMLKVQRPAYFTALTGLALRDAFAARTGRPPVLAPIVAPPGHPAALNSPGALEGMLAVAGPTWRNEFAARLFLHVAAYRPTTVSSQVRCRLLVQVGTEDTSAPPAPAVIAGQRAGATVHRYPCDHFDVYPGRPWHEKVLEDQKRFLGRVLGARAEEDARGAAASQARRVSRAGE